MRPSDRIPPHDIEAEMSLLGSMMLSREAIADVLPVIHREEAHRFYRPDHQKIFRALVDLYDRNDPVDLTTVRNEFERLGILNEVGGVDYIVLLAESVPSYLHAEHYARLVRDKGMLRDLIAATHRIQDQAYGHQEEAKEILDEAEKLLFEVTDQRITSQAEPIHAYLEQIFSQLESHDGHYITGMPTGFTELDDMLSGLQRGEMIIIAARPSMGKTAFGLCAAMHLAGYENKSAVFFSMEMSKQAIVQRLLCSRAGIDSHKLRRGMLSSAEFEALTGIGGQLGQIRLFVDDTPGMSVLELRAKARRLRMQHSIDAIFVDYLQLMHNPGRVESRQQEVSEISRGLKALARELDIPVVVLSQLNRNPEGRTDNRPRMSDLRESGAIEQDADVIMLLHREEYYKRENCPEELRNIAEVIIDKQRNGPTGVVKLQFEQKYTRFANLSYNAEPAYVPTSRYEGGFSPAPPIDNEEDAPF
ncbi:MAG: replicative DNA helicase [Phycisphaerales bacterium]|nr:replicative DNA helicase [Phycisphaerales bacterium]